MAEASELNHRHFSGRSTQRQVQTLLYLFVLMYWLINNNVNCFLANQNCMLVNNIFCYLSNVNSLLTNELICSNKCLSQCCMSKK